MVVDEGGRYEVTVMIPPAGGAVTVEVTVTTD